MDAFFAPITTPITIHKTDSVTGLPLEGVGFTVSGNSSVHGEFSIYGETDEEGKLTFEIPYGRESDIYVLKETKVPRGYRTTANISFTFDENEPMVFNVKNTPTDVPEPTEAEIYVTKVISNIGDYNNSEMLLNQPFILNLDRGGTRLTQLTLNHNETCKKIRYQSLQTVSFSFFNFAQLIVPYLFNHSPSEWFSVYKKEGVFIMKAPSFQTLCIVLWTVLDIILYLVTIPAFKGNAGSFLVSDRSLYAVPSG